MKISIIIPVYNVEKYLSACLESVENQTCKDFEVILINDGSTDNSEAICLAYQEKYPQVIYLNQQNRGLSATRNRGLDVASGDYILFLDSDDAISFDAIELFLLEISKEQADIFMPDYVYRIDSEGKRRIYHQLRMAPNVSLTGPEYLAVSIKKKCYSPAGWLCLYSRQFLEENHLRFVEGIYHEDELWTPQVMLCARKVKIIRNPFYHYYTREGSITQTPFSQKRVRDFIFLLDELEPLYQSYNNKEYRETFLNLWAEQKLLNLMRQYQIGMIEKEELRDLAVQRVKPKINKITTLIKHWLLIYCPPCYSFIYQSRRKGNKTGALVTNVNTEKHYK